MSEINEKFVTAGQVVIFHYTLRDDDGVTLDTSNDDDPMPYLHGAFNIISGLESSMEGRSVGEHFKVTIPPNEGYGALSTKEPIVIPRKEVHGNVEINMPMLFNTGGTERENVWVQKITHEEVTLSLNHPFAGKTLHFECEVMGIRKANDEEMAHGHPHGLDGHSGHQHHEHSKGHKKPKRSLKRSKSSKKKRKQ